MFKVMIAFVLALIAVAMAAPAVPVVYTAPVGTAAYTTYNAGSSYVKPVAAVYSSGAYVPTAYSAGSYVASPVAYSAYPHVYV